MPKDVIPLCSATPPPPLLASTPPRRRRSLFGDSVSWPTRGVVAAVTPLPALAGDGAPRGLPPRLRPSSGPLRASGAGQFSAPRAEVGAGSLSSARCIHSQPPAAWTAGQGSGVSVARPCSLWEIGGLLGCCKPRRRGGSLCLHLGVSAPAVKWTLALTSAYGL